MKESDEPYFSTYHGIQAHSKASMKHCVEQSELAPYYELAMNARFRSNADMDHMIFGYYGKRRGEYELVEIEEHEYIRDENRNCLVKNPAWDGDIRLMLVTQPHWYKKMQGVKQLSVNDNDSIDVPESYFHLFRHFMEKWFPTPSQFEKKCG
ncbi:MAG: hypothetical protein LBL46_05130 [Rickettsiales bacterium]|nr:hypothetical protein [Rickettsiales bacterium]